MLGARAAEINEWLRSNSAVTCGARYCVLDDWDISGSGFDSSKLVRCDCSQGLTAESAAAAIALLTGGS